MPPVATATLTERLQALEHLVRLFRLERIIHLAVMSISVLMLLSSAALLIYRSSADIAAILPALTGLFGSSGLITYSAGRLLKMWDQALQVLQLTKGSRS